MSVYKVGRHEGGGGEGGRGDDRVSVIYDMLGRHLEGDSYALQ